MNLLLLCFLCGITPLQGTYTAWKADAAYKAGDLSNARSLYEDAVAQNPDDMKSLYNVGKMAYKQKDFQTAEQTFALVASHKNHQFKEEAPFNAGDSQLMQRKYVEAQRSFEKVLSINPQNAHAQKRLELIKKLQQEQQKQDQSSDKNQSQKNDQSKSNSAADQNQDNSQQEKDKNRSGNDSNSQESSDESQQTQEGGDKSKGDERSSHQSENQRKNSPQSDPNKSDKSEQSANKEQSTQKDSGTKGDALTSESGADKQNAQKKKDGKGQKKHDTQEPQKKVDNELSIAESQLSQNERAELEKVDEHDKKVFKRFFGRRHADHSGSAGKKNW